MRGIKMATSTTKASQQDSRTMGDPDLIAQPGLEGLLEYQKGWS